MAGFPELPLPNGKVIAAETEEEMESTRVFALKLRDGQAIDMMSLAMVIPLPATDMWECLNIRQKMKILLSAVPKDDPEAAAIREIEQRVTAAYPDLRKPAIRKNPTALLGSCVSAIGSCPSVIMQCKCVQCGPRAKY